MGDAARVFGPQSGVRIALDGASIPFLFACGKQCLNLILGL